MITQIVKDPSAFNNDFGSVRTSNMTFHQINNSQNIVSYISDPKITEDQNINVENSRNEVILHHQDKSTDYQKLYYSDLTPIPDTLNSELTTKS